jgi:hypothetical protein
MRKLVVYALLCAVLLPLVGSCTVSYVSAPPGSHVTLPSDADYATSRFRMKNWYMLWGLIPLSDNNAVNIIGRYNLKNVRTRTYYGFGDMIIDIIFAGLVTSTTTEVVSNTAQQQ